MARAVSFDSFSLPPKKMNNSRGRLPLPQERMGLGLRSSWLIAHRNRSFLFDIFGFGTWNLFDIWSLGFEFLLYL